MRTRYKSYDFYGINETEKQELLRICQNLDAEQENMLLSCAIEASGEVIGKLIVVSLMYGCGYVSLNKFCYIPLKADDFYAYRRKTLWLFKSKLKEITTDGKI